VPVALSGWLLQPSGNRGQFPMTDHIGVNFRPNVAKFAPWVTPVPLLVRFTGPLSGPPRGSNALTQRRSESPANLLLIFRRFFGSLG